MNALSSGRTAIPISFAMLTIAFQRASESLIKRLPFHECNPAMSKIVEVAQGDLGGAMWTFEPLRRLAPS